MKVFEERMAEEGNKVQIEKSKLEESAEIMGISAIKYSDLKREAI